MLGCWLCSTGLLAHAGPLVNTDSPIGFFTNVADRLLQSQLVANGGGPTGVIADAYFTQPTNDWRVASLLISLLSTNDPRSLASVNQPDAGA